MDERTHGWRCHVWVGANSLQLAEHVVIALAASGELPGRRLDGEWRFSKAGLIAWLEAPDLNRKARSKT